MGRDTFFDTRVLVRLFVCLLIMGSAFAGIKQLIPDQLSVFASLFFLAILNFMNGYDTLVSGRRKQARFLWLAGVVSLIIAFVSLF